MNVIPAPVSRAWNDPPRNPYGPCSHPCGHGYCAALHQYAAEICILCNQPIGFDNDFVEFYDGQLIHLPCPTAIDLQTHPSFWRRILNRLKGVMR